MLLKKINIFLVIVIIFIVSLICLIKQYVYINGKIYSVHCQEIELYSHYSKRPYLENLKRFDDLEEISISFFSQEDMNKIGDILKGNDKIKIINIYICDAVDCSFLNYLPNLEKIHILETEVDFSNIVENASLEKLEIINCNVNGIENLNLFYNLNSISISVCQEVDILNFTNLKYLKTMKLITIGTIKNIEELSLLKELESLTIINVPNFNIEYDIFDSMLNLKSVKVSEHIISDDDKNLLNRKGVSVEIKPDNKKENTNIFTNILLFYGFFVFPPQF